MQITMSQNTKTNTIPQLLPFLPLLLLFAFSACDKSDDRSPAENTAAILLVIDEESIDNGNEPNNFSETDVNDQLAEIGLRKPLR